MNNKESVVKLTRRRLLGGVTAAGLAAGGAGAGTFAYFTDSATSADNSVQAGTMDLKLSDGDEDAQDGVSGTITVSNLVPGGPQYGGEVTLENAGTLEADHVEIDFDVAENEASHGPGSDEADTAPSSAAGFAEMIQVDSLLYPKDSDPNQTNLLGSVSDSNGNGIVDLEDVANHGVFDQLEPPPPSNGGTESLDVQLSFVSEQSAAYSGSRVANDYQGDEVDITIDFALAQADGQDVL
ncbi:MAG: TasA family protein [Halobacteriaceae archaeon]